MFRDRIRSSIPKVGYPPICTDPWITYAKAQSAACRVAAVAVPSIQSIPVRVHDGRRLADLSNDEHQLFIGNPTYVDLDVQQIVRGELGSQSPGYDVEILKSFDDAGDRAGISVCDDLKPSPRIRVAKNPWNQCLIQED